MQWSCVRRWLAAAMLWGPLLACAAPRADVAGSVGTVYLFPSGMEGSLFGHDMVEPGVPSGPGFGGGLFHDQGDNVWWKRAWPAFESAAERDLARLRELYGANQRILLLVYFPVYLADPVHGSTYVDRLGQVLARFNAAGIETLLFLGRPEFDGDGRSADYHDVVHDGTARARLLAMVDAALAHPQVAEHVRLVAVYYLGLTTAIAFTEAEILDYNRALKGTINARGMQYVQHVDGPFWEHQDAANPNGGTWYQNGYTPASIGADNGASDFLFAESWVQGVLRAGVERLVGEGRFARDRILLMNDIPNCDDPAIAADYPCAGWPEIQDVEGNNAYWFDCVRKLRLTAWSAWSFGDGALDDPNPYGRVANDGMALTLNGRTQQAWVRGAFRIFGDGAEAGAGAAADLCGPPG